MLDVVIAGQPFDTARNVLVTLRPEGNDASFEISLDTKGIDPLFFSRPSAVEIYADFRDGRERCFEGFLGVVEDDNATARVTCIDGKKLLEKTMLEATYPQATLLMGQHAEALLSASRALNYYAPPMDTSALGTSLAFSANDGQHLRQVFDELFKGYEWTVKNGLIVLRVQIGTDRTESVLIKTDVASSVTDFLGIANVVLATTPGDVHIVRDGDSQDVYGYALGTVERVEGKAGASFEEHAEAVLEETKEARPVWTATKVLSEFVFVEGGDTVSVDLPCGKLRTPPTALRIAEVQYDFTAGTQTMTLSSDGTKPKVVPQRLKEMEERVRLLSL